MYIRPHVCVWFEYEFLRACFVCSRSLVFNILCGSSQNQIGELVVVSSCALILDSDSIRILHMGNSKLLGAPSEFSFVLVNFYIASPSIPLAALFEPYPFFQSLYKIQTISKPGSGRELNNMLLLHLLLSVPIGRQPLPPCNLLNM